MSFKLVDTAIGALWSPQDEQKVERGFEAIKAGVISPESFDQKLYRVFNDQTARFESSQYQGKLFEPMKVTAPKDDLVPTVGMRRIAELVTGKNSAYFTFFGSGTGDSPEDPADETLAAENYRVSMVTDGFAEVAGTTMKFAGKFPTFVPTATITEGGAFDLGQQGSGTMLFRTVYPIESRLQHVQNNTFYTLTQSISIISVT